jgi:membrane protease YdiL (CAAX protease family)
MVLLAALFWFVTFYVRWGIFWYKISFSATALAALSMVLARTDRPRFSLNLKAIIIGLATAAGLYLIFWLSKTLATVIFPFAPAQIGAIYDKGQGTSTWLIALLLFFVTSPAEEIFWRGYLQRSLMQRLGGWQGWLLATAVYAGVHIWSLNFMLIGAAGVAGAFWGVLYWRLKNLAPVIVSHAVWSTFIFAVMPVP